MNEVKSLVKPKNVTLTLDKSAAKVFKLRNLKQSLMHRFYFTDEVFIEYTTSDKTITFDEFKNQMSDFGGSLTDDDLLFAYELIINDDSQNPEPRRFADQSEEAKIVRAVLAENPSATGYEFASLVAIEAAKQGKKVSISFIMSNYS